MVLCWTDLTILVCTITGRVERTNFILLVFVVAQMLVSRRGYALEFNIYGVGNLPMDRIDD